MNKLAFFSNKVLKRTIALAQIEEEILLWSLRNKRLERIAGIASKTKNPLIAERVLVSK